MDPLYQWASGKQRGSDQRNLFAAASGSRISRQLADTSQSTCHAPAEPPRAETPNVLAT